MQVAKLLSRRISLKGLPWNKKEGQEMVPFEMLLLLPTKLIAGQKYALNYIERLGPFFEHVKFGLLMAYKRIIKD